MLYHSRKDFTFHIFPKDPRSKMEWAVKMKRSDSKFKSNTSGSVVLLRKICFYGLQAQFKGHFLMSMSSLIVTVKKGKSPLICFARREFR